MLPHVIVLDLATLNERRLNLFFPTVIKMQSHIVYTLKILALLESLSEPVQEVVRRWVGRETRKWGKKKPTHSIFIMLYSVVK